MKGYMKTLICLALCSMLALCSGFPSLKHHKTVQADADLSLESHETVKAGVRVRDDVDADICHNSKQAKVRRSSNSTACNMCLLYLPITISCPAGYVIDIDNYRCMLTSGFKRNALPLSMIHKKISPKLADQIIGDVCAEDENNLHACQAYISCRARSSSIKHCMRTLRLHSVVKRQIKFLIPDKSDYAIF